MATINEELNYLEETKSLIKQAIINKGQDITDQDSFRSYVNKIDDISTMNAQTKIVNPTTNTQNIEPDEGFNALNKVIVSGVTNTIDNNIQVNNIKAGVTILGVTGNFIGTDISDATATEEDILEGKTAYTNTGKIEGILPMENLVQPMVQNITSDNYIINIISNLDGMSGKLVINNSTNINLYIPLSDITNVIDAEVKLDPVIQNISSDNYIINIISNFEDLSGKILVDNVTNISTHVPFSDITNVIDAEVELDPIIQNITSDNYIINIISNLDGMSGKILVDNVTNIPVHVSFSDITNIVDAEPTIYPSVLSIMEDSDVFYINMNTDISGKMLIDSVTNIPLTLSASEFANVINLTSGQIKSGETILGITGTYTGEGIKEYASETAMNNDIANIQEGEVVKVVVTSGIAGDVDNPLTTTITHYIKETTMKKLVKESETISPQEYEENVDLANDILGEEE